jgi:cation:H+ antiporter
MIYATAAFFHRRRYGRRMRSLKLEADHSVEVIGLLVPLVYMIWVWYKATLTLWDGLILAACYVAYLVVLCKMPPQGEEAIEDLDRVPRFVVKSPPVWRTVFIALLFVGGGALIYFMAEPFLGGLLAVSAVIGVPSFVFVQLVAPFVSEFPEKVSAFYWARTVDRASTALMNMVSSNINQWTLLPAMLIAIYAWSCGSMAAVIRFTPQQELELLLTIAQSLVGMIFLVNMELGWREAAALFSLWLFQFVLSPIEPGPGVLRQIAAHAHWITTAAYFAWFGVEALRLALGRKQPLAFIEFARAWRERVLRRA